MKTYITGGTGFVGSNIAKLYSDWHGLDVVVAGRHAPERESRAKFVELDLEDPQSIRASLTAEAPDLVIHAAILNDFDLMYADRQLAWSVYVEATRHLIDGANTVGARFIFVSTDWVFDGTHAESDEATPPNPVNYYGVLKAIGETVTLERATHPIVARISGVNGSHWSRSTSPRTQDAGFGHYVAALVDALAGHRPFSVWESPEINQRATPSLASECGEMMLQLALKGEQGVFHCCGGESMTRMQLARAAADVFELNADLIQSGEPDPGAMLSAPVPVDTSLSAVHTASAIDYALPSVHALLAAFREQRETGQVRPIAVGADEANEKEGK
jgi:dTDP-4-dehydrorhamnose reductase